MIDIEQPLEPQIRLELVTSMLDGLGYTLDASRIERISQGMRDYMDEGLPASCAFAESLEIEFLLYGDPDAKVQDWHLKVVEITAEVLDEPAR